MSCLKANFVVHETNCLNPATGLPPSRVCSSIGALRINPQFKTLDFPDRTTLKIKTPNLEPVIAKGQRWWEKSLQTNMEEIQSAQQLVDLLQNSGDTLVVLSFYSPGCGGCRALHPKICQMAGMNPKAIFLKINYEKHRAMCGALNVHVLPFFRFYRGDEGRVCSFSCTNATIKKLKDALSKHGTDRCGLGSPAKGLNEEEMGSLVSLGLIEKDLCLRH